MCPWSTVTSTSTPVAMSIQPGSSFCLCCFWQAVRHLWSLHMSGIPHHTDLLPSRNIKSKSWFILSVLFFTGGETSVHPTCVRDSPSHVGMSTLQAVSFCLCCFWQAVRRLWSLHMSEIHRQADLHSSSNGYPTSWFILSVLFLTGGQTSVVP